MKALPGRPEHLWASLLLYKVPRYKGINCLAHQGAPKPSINYFPWFTLSLTPCDHHHHRNPCSSSHNILVLQNLSFLIILRCSLDIYFLFMYQIMGFAFLYVHSAECLVCIHHTHTLLQPSFFLSLLPSPLIVSHYTDAFWEECSFFLSHRKVKQNKIKIYKQCANCKAFNDCDSPTRIHKSIKKKI